MNGTSAADSSTNGSWAARQLPSSGSKTAIEAAATIEVSGIQWPLLGTGRVGIGRQLAAHLQEAPQRRGGEAMPIGQLLGDHQVVGRIGVRRVVDQPGRPDPNEKGQAEQDQQVPPAHRRPQITAVESSYSRSHSGESSSQRDSSQSGGSTAWSMP